MATLEGTTRKLPFVLSSTEDMESEVGSEEIAHLDLSGWSESDPDVKTLIVLNLSLNEYIALASTIDVGRDIAYGDHSIFIWWLWIRSLESMAICDAIIACINDADSGVADAMINITNNSDNILNVAQGQENLPLAGGNNPTCDKDVWYGGIDNLVNSLHENNLDSLQILEVATNVTEWLVDVVAGVFGIKAPVAQSMAEWALFIQNSILENYEAQWTQQYRETITCDLLCIAMENCELTPQQIIDYFYGRLGSQLTFGSLITESLQFLVFGVWSGTEIVDAMILSQLVFRAQFGRWFEHIAFNSIDVDIALGFNDASNDWELICDPCGWLSNWYNGDGDVVGDGWTYTLGTYDSGDDDANSTFNGTSSHLAYIEYIFTAETTITRIEFDGRLVKNSTLNRVQMIRRIDVDNTVTNLATTTPTGTGIKNYTLEFTGSELFEVGDKIEVWASVSSSLNSTCEIKRLLVEGDGSNPF